MATYAGGLFTPQTVLDEMNQIDVAMTSLGEDIAASKVPANFKSKFASFRASWGSFYRAHDSGFLDWISRTLNSTYAQVLSYKQAVLDWRARFISVGGKPSSPPLPQGPMGSQKSIQTIAVVAAAIFGGLLLIRR